MVLGSTNLILGRVVAGSRIGLNWARPRHSGTRASKRYRMHVDRLSGQDVIRSLILGSPSPPYRRNYRYADDRRVGRNHSR